MIVSVVEAQSFQSDNDVTVAKSKFVSSTLWASWKNIDIAGTVKGDVFCVGQNVTINGTVEGDAISASQIVTISVEVDHIT